MASKKNNPFWGKKITVMGLGLLGGLLNDIRFLADHGAELTVTDLKKKEELKPSLAKLQKYKNIKFVLGEHRLEDFRGADMILQPGNVPLDSPYLAEAKKNNIPIFVGESLFARYAPEVVMVGITGTRGKSTVTQLIYEILRQDQDKSPKRRVFLGGNVKNVSTLALLDQVKGTLNASASGKGDIVVMELDSWALHGMGDIKQSPHLAVFTNFMVDHQNFYGSAALTTGKNAMDLYFADKANIFLNQKEGDHLVAGRDILRRLQKEYKNIAKRTIVPDAGIIPKNWKVKLLGEHNLQNIAYAIAVAHLLDIPQAVIKKTVEDFKGIPGRLEFVREVKGVKYYNDTTATTPDGVIAALKAFGSKNVILLGGGADKGLDYIQYAKEIPKHVKALILFKGSATEKILKQLRITNYELRMEIQKNKIPVVVVDNMKEAMSWTKKYAQKGDIVLLSPGAASFGTFKNEFDRGEQFNYLVKKLK